MKKPLVAFCGSTRGDLAALYALGVTDVVTIARESEPLADAMANATKNLERALTSLCGTLK